MQYQLPVECRHIYRELKSERPAKAHRSKVSDLGLTQTYYILHLTDGRVAKS